MLKRASGLVLLALTATLLATGLLGCAGGDDPAATDGAQDADAAATDQELTDDGQPVAEVEPEPIDMDVQEPTVAPLAQSRVRIYFPSFAGDGLIAEDQEIFETKTPGDRAKQIIASLIDGPESSVAMRAVPRGTALRQAYVLDSGVAYLDFSRDLAEGLGGGSAREMYTVYAIVDSVTRNVPEIKSVGLLIEGKIPDTLNGHLDLRYPLRPNYSLVLNAGVAQKAEPSTPVRVAGTP